MDDAYVRSTSEVLDHFHVSEQSGLSDKQVISSEARYGRNGMNSKQTASVGNAENNMIALPEDPPTPIWKLIFEQFKDQLVIILLGSAAISFLLALFEDSGDWTAFVDPIVVRIAYTRLYVEAC